MTTTAKILGQSAPRAASLTDVYTGPALTSTTVSTVLVSNSSATPTAFRISVAIGGGGDSPDQYLYYDIPIPGNDTFAATLGITLAATDVMRVYNTLATCSFNIFGVEIS